MITAATPANEAERLASLYKLNILDTPPEERFDRLTRLAAAMFDVSMAFVSLLDTNRQWFKSCVGIPEPQSPRDISFCSHTILKDEMLVILDPLADHRFADNPFVTNPPHIRFYAGYPLKSLEGHNIGTFCIADSAPRSTFNERDRALLLDLASLARDELNFVAVRELQDKLVAMNKNLQTENEYRKQAEDELRETMRQVERSRYLMKTIIDATPDWLYVKDLDGRFIMVNQSFAEAIKRLPQDIVGKTEIDLEIDQHLSITPTEDSHETKPTKQMVYQPNSPIIFSDGRKQFHDIYKIPLYDDSQQLTSRLTVSRNITARKMMEEEQAKNIRLQEIDRAKSQFVTMVSHELRTPLHAINGFAELLLMDVGGDLSAANKEDVQLIYNNGQQLLAIVNDLIDIAQIESGEISLTLEMVDANMTVTDLISNMSSLTTSKPLAVVTELTPDLPYVRADPTRLWQILTNLISNAIKFTKEGTITVCTHPHTAEFVKFTVRDTGIGIPNDKLERIFDLFTQADMSDARQYGGLGVGLSICKMLVDMQHGEIGVESQEGAGSEFWFTMPIFDEG